MKKADTPETDPTPTPDAPTPETPAPETPAATPPAPKASREPTGQRPDAGGSYIRQPDGSLVKQEV